MGMLFRSISRSILLTLLAVIVIGCGGGPQLLPVSGVVTLDGQPVADAGVLFVPADSGPTTSGTTDAAGRFRLTTANRSGTLAGRYHIAVNKREFVGDRNLGPLPTVAAKDMPVKWIIPEKYSRAETSGLEATVDRSQCEFTFALTSR